MTQSNRQEEAFATWLESLVTKEDRAVLAALRRGLSVDPDRRAWMLRYLPANLLSDRQEDVMCLIASLFASHPLSWPKDQARTWTNIGASLRRLAADELAETGEMPSRIEARLEAMLQSHRDDLPEHLRRIVGLLRAKDIPVDWAQLLHDIGRWDWRGRPVQREWARAFWRPQQETAGEADPAPDQPREEREEAV